MLEQWRQGGSVVPVACTHDAKDDSKVIDVSAFVACLIPIKLAVVLDQSCQWLGDSQDARVSSQTVLKLEKARGICQRILHK